MTAGTVNGLLEYIHPAQDYLQLHFGLDATTAREVVKDVLLEFFRNGPEKLRRPRRSFFYACRIRAFQILRSRRRQEKGIAVVANRRKEAGKKDTVVLVALEDEDKPKFFSQAKLKQQEVFELLIEAHTQAEVSAILEAPESTVRMRIHLARKKLDPTG